MPEILISLELPMSVGMARYTVELLKYLVRTDLLDIAVVNTDPVLGSRYSTDLVLKFIKGLDCKAHLVGPAYVPVLRRTINSRLVVPAKVLKIARNYTLIHSFNHLTPVGASTGKLLSRYSVVTVYDLIPYHFMEYRGVGYSSVLKVYRRADALVAISYSVADELVKYVGVERSKIFVSYPIISDNFRPIPNARESLGIPNDVFVVLYVGSAEPKRREPLLAFLKAIKELGNDVLTVFVGPFKRLSTYVGTAKVFRNVSDSLLRTLYSACDVFVYPTKAEGFGIPVLEAMSCGAPVLVPDIPVMREVVDHAGVLVKDFTDWRGWFRALKVLKEDEGLRKYLSKASLIRAKSFNPQESIKSLLNAWLSTLKK